MSHRKFTPAVSGPNALNLTQTKNALRSAEELRGALEAMLVASKSVVAHLNERFDDLVTQVGFELLSNDVLSLIFEFAHDVETSQVPESLSQVNRRFRKLAIGMPGLWTHISSRRSSASKATEIVARSSDSSRTLSIALECHQTHGSRADSLSKYFHVLVLPSMERLRSLTLHVNLTSGLRPDVSLLDKLHKSHQSLDFPVLQTLEITYDNFASGRDALPDTAHFYSQWTMPSLRTLRARNLVPVFPDPLLSKVTSCRLELDYNTDLFAGGGWDVEEIVMFLGSLGDVEELDFTLHYQHFTISDITAPFAKLSRLSLVFGMYGIASCENFFSLFFCPNLKWVSVEVVLAGNEMPGSSICLLLDCLEFSKIIVDLGITIRHEPNREDSDDFYDSQMDVISRAGRLSHVANMSIDYQASRDDNEGFFDFSRKIRSLRIQDCAGSVNKLLGILNKRTSNFEDAVDPNDETCLRITQDTLKDWGVTNEGS